MTYPHHLIGRLIEGRYLVRAHLADGGMGSVYVAEDVRLRRDIALKVLRPDLARNPRFVERFRREAQAAARLNHIHVVAVHDQGQDDDVVFLAMELVPGGRTLRDVIQTGGISVEQALRLMEDVASGLASAHRAGLIHRDIKPENVLVTPDGQIKVADFGLARAVTATGMSATSDALVGTAPYLAPEQVTRGWSDTRSDVYAAGLVLFELLTGARAFDGENPVAIAYQHVNAPMPRPSSVAEGLTADVDSFFERVCAKDPSQRPVDALALGTELRLLRKILPADVLANRSQAGPAGVAATNRTTVFSDREEFNGHQLESTRPLDPGSAHQEHRTRPVWATSTQRLPLEPSVTSRQVSRRTPLIAAGVALAGAGAAALAYAGGLFTPRTEVPRVVGHSQGSAVSALRRAGLSVKVSPQDNDTIPQGQVIASDPAAGSAVRPDSTVTLSVSSGPRRITVPSVTSLSPEKAEHALRDAGFSALSRSEEFSEVESGKVINTNPVSGRTVSHLTPITIRVSKGREEVTVPDVTDADAQQAQARLRELGLRVKTVTEPDADVAAGRVLSTSPEADTRMFAGDDITLTVSSGPRMVTVPDVVGMSAGEAARALSDAGFEASGVDWTDELFNRTVAGQDPAGGAGQQAKEGSTVTLRF